VRPDETSATVRCHYLTDGAVNFAFAIRRAEFFIPVGVLLKCFVEASDRELFGYLVASAPQDAGARAQAAPACRAPHVAWTCRCAYRARTQGQICSCSLKSAGSAVREMDERCPAWGSRPRSERVRARAQRAAARSWRSARSNCCARRPPQGCARARSAWSTSAATFVARSTCRRGSPTCRRAARASARAAASHE